MIRILASLALVLAFTAQADAGPIRNWLESRRVHRPAATPTCQTCPQTVQATSTVTTAAGSYQTVRTCNGQTCTVQQVWVPAK